MSGDAALLLLPMFETSSTAQAQMGAPCQVHRSRVGASDRNIWLVNEGPYLAIARPAQRAPDQIYMDDSRVSTETGESNGDLFLSSQKPNDQRSPNFSNAFRRPASSRPAALYTIRPRSSSK